MSAPDRTAGGPPERSVDALIDDALRSTGTGTGADTGTGTGAEPAAGDSWWRRNRIPLAALLLVAAVCTGVLGMTVWGDHLGVRPSVVVPVAADGVSDYAGAEWSVDSVERLSGSDPLIDPRSVASGVDVVFVRILIRPSGGQPLCTVQLLEERESGPDRRWSSESGGLRADYDPDRVTSCRSEPDGTYTAEFAFQIPAKADGDLSLEVVVPDALPEFLRLELV